MSEGVSTGVLGQKPEVRKELEGPHISRNSKRGRKNMERQERANRWGQTGLALSGSRLRMRAEGAEILL